MSLRLSLLEMLARRLGGGAAHVEEDVAAPTLRQAIQERMAAPEQLPDIGAQAPTPSVGASHAGQFVDNASPDYLGARRLARADGRAFIDYKVDPQTGEWQVRQQLVDSPSDRGQGLGSGLYEELLRRAEATGAPRVRSDQSVSNDAAEVYDAMRRRGYDVSETPNEYGRPTFTVDLTRRTANAPDASSAGAPHHVSRFGRDIYEPEPGVEMEIAPGGLTLFTYRGSARPGGGTGPEALRVFRGAYRALVQDAERTNRPQYKWRPETERQAALYREAMRTRAPAGYEFSEDERGYMYLRRTLASPDGGNAGAALLAGGLGGGLTLRELLREKYGA